MSPANAPTIWDVARAAGTSASTVSRVLNGHGQVRAATRDRVLRELRRLDYHPNAAARGLVTRRAGAIGLVVPSISNPFHAELVEGVEEAAAGLGFHVLVVQTGEDAQREREAATVLRGRADGLLVASAEVDDATVRQLVRDGFPVVLLAREVPDSGVSCAMGDDFAGGYLATRHLLELGHRALAMVAEPFRYWGARQRREGYFAALRDAGLASDGARVVEVGVGDIASGHAAAGRLLAEVRPTAIFAQNDLLALGAIRACRAAGLSVPRDVSVVGYDGTILAQVADPPLTTIAQPTRDIGAAGMDLLDDLLETPARRVRKIVLPPHLQVGGTTAPARTG